MKERVYIILFVGSLLLSGCVAGNLRTHHYPVPFKQDHKFGYRNASGAVIISPQYGDAKAFSEGLAAVGVGQLIEVLAGPQDSGFFLDGKYGYIDAGGKMVISAQFDEAYDFKNGLAQVRKGKRFGLIDRAGKWVEDTQPEN